MCLYVSECVGEGADISCSIHWNHMNEWIESKWNALHIRRKKRIPEIYSYRNWTDPIRPTYNVNDSWWTENRSKEKQNQKLLDDSGWMVLAVSEMKGVPTVKDVWTTKCHSLQLPPSLFRFESANTHSDKLFEKQYKGRRALHYVGLITNWIEIHWSVMSSIVFDIHIECNNKYIQSRQEQQQGHTTAIVSGKKITKTV